MLAVFKRLVLALLCVWLIALPTAAQDIAGLFDADASRQAQLEAIDYALRTVDDLLARGILSEAEAAAQRRYYLSQTESADGEPLTRAQLERELDAGEGFQWSRILNFVNIIWVFAGLIIAISVTLIFSIYVWPLLRMIPIVVYELLAYIVAFGFILFAGQITDADTAQFAALPGNLILAGLLLFSYGYHIERPRQQQQDAADDSDDAAPAPGEPAANDDALDRVWVIYFGILTVVWGASAIAYDSQLIGVMTIYALLGLLYVSGFIIWVVTLFSFRQDELIPMAVMLVSLGGLLIYIAAEAADIAGPYTVFETGIYLLGGYGYFITLEVLSTSWFRSRSGGGFWRWQAYSLVAGLAGMLVGVLFAIDGLTEVAGTFLLIFSLTKYVELVNWREYTVWGLLGLGVLLYGCALLINRYPSLFLLG